MKLCGIYLLRHDATGRGYVGQSIDITDRVRGHSKGNDPWHLGRAIAKYGWEAFTLTVLETCACRADLNEAETKWIAALGTLEPAGFNMTTGGCQAFTFSEATRQRISERTKEGQTAEVRARMSASKKGVPKSPEWCAQMSERQKQPDNVARLRALSSNQSPETRAKQSAAAMGKKASPETRAKISAGKKAANDVKRAAGISLSPPPMSAETRAKMSASAKARCAREAAEDPAAVAARQPAAAAGVKSRWGRVRVQKATLLAADQPNLL